MNTHKKMMYDDLIFAPMVIFAGYLGVTKEHPAAGSILILLGAVWLALRLYHLTHQEKVFGKDGD